MSPRSMIRATAILLVAALAPAGCGGDASPEENPNAEACEHIRDATKAVAITAATTASASAPEVKADHKRYDDNLDGGMGHVRFAATEAGDAILFADQQVELAVQTVAGANVAAESTATSIPECTQVKIRAVYPLQVGTYVIRLVGSSASKVGLVIEAHGH
jgi:hypothetical protein